MTRRFDVIVVWSLDRLGRSLKHLVGLLDDLQATGIGIISLREGTRLDDPERAFSGAAPRHDRRSRTGAAA